MEYIIHSRRNRNCLGVIEESSGLLCPERPRLAAHSAFLIETGHLYICHYSDVIMSMMASQITGVTIVYSTECSGTGQRKHQSSASLAYVRGIHRWPVNSPHKGPVTRKMFPFDDVIMIPFTPSLRSLAFRRPILVTKKTHRQWSLAKSAAKWQTLNVQQALPSQTTFRVRPQRPTWLRYS